MAGLQLVQDGEYPGPLLGRVVEAQMEFRDAPDAQLAETVPDEGHRPTERPDRRLALVGRADDRGPDRAVSQVGRDLDACDGHEPDARILDLAADDAADLLAQELIDTQGALGHRGTTGAQALGARETVCCVKHSTMSPSSRSW